MIVFIVRTILIYIIIIFAMRLMGKKQLGELQPSELVSTILISNLASIPIESTDIPLANSLLPILLIVSLEILTSAICVHSRGLATLISGRPKIIIRDGVVDQKTLKTLRFTIDDLLEALRAKDIFDLDEVCFAIVETNGTISIYKNNADSTPTRKDLNIPMPQNKKPCIPIIIQGEINTDALTYCEKSQKWLEKTLKKENISPNAVLLMTCNDTETYKIIKKENS
ncbi:MAG: DUF421 domain-containing protein [Oscillospiraceae bacterium]|nr:DUF421 domain-containing protein [Oscillospiraceae bacterium]